jgi:ribosomal-protein-alanine N-acetyltransferase
VTTVGAMQPFRLVGINADGTLEQPTVDLSPDDREACQAMVELYRKVGFQAPWIGYVAVDHGAAVGGGAFVGPPADNRVEIAYYTSPEHQGKGYATLTARRLVAIARETAPDVQLSAKTEPRANASTNILTGLGFNHVGVTTDDEIGEAWLWLLSR